MEDGLLYQCQYRSPFHSSFINAGLIQVTHISILVLYTWSSSWFPYFDADDFIIFSTLEIFFDSVERIIHLFTKRHRPVFS